MNIRAIILSSAAALSFGTVAHAADAIVAAEPEPMEYVRVCDAFGAGFFYIPGTETCLKIDGYVRFQTNVGKDLSGTSDWDSFTRGQLNFDARSDTEFGALRGYIGLRGNADSASTGRGVNIDQAFIELGGLKVGYFYNYWDDDLSGETDSLANGTTAFNSIRYNYTTDTFFVGLGVDELEYNAGSPGDMYTDAVTRFGSGLVVRPNTPPYGRYNIDANNNIGISGTIGGKMGPATLTVVGGYDTDQENGAVRVIGTADIGPGTLGLAAIWASGRNAYYDQSEWTVAAEYAVKLTDKLSVTPGFQYYWTVDQNFVGDFTRSNDKWAAGVTVDYQIAKNFAAKVSAQYSDVDNGTPANSDVWSGFFRLQRSF